MLLLTPISICLSVCLHTAVASAYFSSKAAAAPLSHSATSTLLNTTLSGAGGTSVPSSHGVYGVPGQGYTSTRLPPRAGTAGSSSSNSSSGGGHSSEGNDLLSELHRKRAELDAQIRAMEEAALGLSTQTVTAANGGCDGGSSDVGGGGLATASSGESGGGVVVNERILMGMVCCAWRM